MVERLRPGAWRVWVRAHGHAHGHVDFDVQPGDLELQRTLTLGQSAHVQARVPRSPQFPAGATESSSLRLENLRSTPLWGAWTLDAEAFVNPTVKADGTFDSGDLLPGAYELHYSGPAEVAYQRFELEPGELRTSAPQPRVPCFVRLTASPPQGAGILEGRLFSSSGEWRSPPVGKHRSGPGGTEPLTLGFLVPEGSWTYELTYRPLEGAALSAQGSSTLTAGEPLEVNAQLH